jgi:(1->4)-alpha-D-glucan 1-alpha-D-glucosylmutase
VTDAPSPAWRATYRVQLHAGFTFDDAAAVVPYLAELGISHLYCSPYLQAAPGSTHGYDVIDHSRLNEELGGEEAFARLRAALAEHGMGQLLDIVPNHMALAGRRNPWWWDVLENGPSSQYASYFDIDWEPPESKLRHTVLMPILGDHYGRVLEAGELQVERTGGSFVLRYYENEVPLSPRSLDELLGAAAEAVRSDELASIATALGRLPHALATDRESVRERHRDKEVLRASLERLCEEAPEVATAIDAEIKSLNADPDALDTLIERQNYRLAFWRTAGQELDYRRFFDITTLVALRTEDENVFEDVHALVLQLVDDGAVNGLRIDHVDGLRDPEGYLQRLATRTGKVHTVVEKILEAEESLPSRWPVAGTSGYDFLVRVNSLFVDSAGEEEITAAYERFTGLGDSYEDVQWTAKHEVMRTVLAADVERLTALLVQVCERHRRYRDYTRGQLREVLRELIAAFPVYRTYVHPGREISPEDVEHLSLAAKKAMERRPELDPDLVEFVVDVLMLREDGDVERELAARFQQVSSPVMAKGVEDTAFYRYLRLSSLNEVGGDPGRFGMEVDEFHDRQLEGAEKWPRALLATSTHDTKRSEDVRTRLNLLAEMPAAWDEAIWRWAHMNERHRVDGLPDRNAEYLLYQTLVGAWPLPADRAVAYMQKASKEAKVHTSWIDPAPQYDEALQSFIEAVLADDEFVADLSSFVDGLVEPGRVTSLAQTTLKLTCPGMPDIYQGTELWDLSLVDPDNRRPVDYDLRRAIVEGGDGEGAEKLRLIRRLLRLRAEEEDTFSTGGYSALAVNGPKGRHAVAYLRGDRVAVVVPRLVLGVRDGWEGTTVALPEGGWEHLLTGATFEGGEVPVETLLAPVAVLRRT